MRCKVWSTTTPTTAQMLRMKSLTDATCLADIFLKYSPFFKSYTERPRFRHTRVRGMTWRRKTNSGSETKCGHIPWSRNGEYLMPNVKSQSISAQMI